MKKTLHENKLLSARLSGYAAAAGAMFALAPTAQGQVVYSGPQNLELNLPEDNLLLDLDTNMVDDFAFIMYGYSDVSTYGPYSSRYAVGFGLLLNPKTDSYQNSWITKMTTVRSIYSSYAGTTYKFYTELPDGLESGEIIDPLRGSWTNITSMSGPAVLGFYYAYSYNGPSISFSYLWLVGDFPGNEKYLGIRFYIGDAQHYGWIRVAMGDLVEPMTIVDWAYETTPGVRILAGEGLGLDLPPNLMISGGNGATSDSTRTLTIIAGEEITGFEESDILLTNATADNFTEVDPGLQYTIDITAVAEGKVTVEIPAGAVTDLTANENTPSVANWKFDLTGPVVDFSYVPEIINYPAYWFEADFNEEVTGLESSDLTITNGTIDFFDSYNNGFSLGIIASAEGEVSIELDEGAVTDLAGNPSAAAIVSWIYDATPPEVILDAGVTSTSQRVNSVDVTFSEQVDYLLEGNFVLSNGSATNFETISAGLHYSLEVMADDAGIVIVTLPENGVWDRAGNGNASASVGWLYEPVGLNPVIEEGILIFPNPVSNLLHIELEGEAKVQITDLNGKIVFQQERLQNEAIDVSHFNPGVYITRIQTDEKITQHKIIIE